MRSLIDQRFLRHAKGGDFMAKELALVVKTIDDNTERIFFDPTLIPDEKKPDLAVQLKKAAGEIVVGTAYRISVRLSELNNGQIDVFVNPAIHNDSDKNKAIGQLSEILRAAAAE